MRWALAIIVPLAVLAGLYWFTRSVWLKLAEIPKFDADKVRPTEELSKRIYLNFEFFVKIFLALVGAFG